MKQPHVLDGDHRLVGKGFKQLDLRRSEGAKLDSASTEMSYKFRLLTKRNVKSVRQLPLKFAKLTSVCSLISGICKVPWSRIQRKYGPSTLISNASDWNRTKMGPRNNNVSLAQSQDDIINPTNPSSTLHDRIEHRLHVGWRPADDAEHLGRCRLMLQRLPQFSVALLIP